MRRRRKAKRIREIQNSNEHLNESIYESVNEGINDKLNLPSKVPETEMTSEEPSLANMTGWKDVDIDTIIKCEGDFFCEVIRRLSKEINGARDRGDLEDIICLAAKFLQASADKEKAIACQIAASKGVCNIGKKNSNCVCDLDDHYGE